MTITREQLYNIWFNVWDIHGWLRILRLGNCLFPSAYKELEKIDDRAIDYIEEAKIEYAKDKVNRMMEMKKFEGEFKKEWVRKKRITYLVSRIRILNNSIRTIWKEQARRNKTSIPSWLKETFKELDNIKERQIQLKKLTNEKYFLENPAHFKVIDKITQQDIDRADAFPFEDLVEFNKAGFAFCPKHSEKIPSLHLIKSSNRIYCFGCGYSASTIKFLMDRNNLSFKEAVQKLS